jgi:ABC-2 type transport system permease protein
MNNAVVIAKKEWKDILRSKMFMYVVLILIVLTITSLTVSFFVFSSQVNEYQQSLEVLKQLGKEPTTPPPTLYPLNLLRGVVDYIEIVGAVLGIMLGYISISKERNTKALKILLTKPLTKKDIAYGKILGNTFFILIFMSIVGLFVLFSIFFIGGVVLTAEELFKIILFIIFSTVYILLFFMLSFFFTLQQKTITHALIISFIIWLTVVLILPQIGDTMDPDNQVPGGLFSSLNVNKTQEKQIMGKFSGYENTRDFIEQLSITKHYERTVFALFGINNIYNDVPLSTILSDNIWNMMWVVVAAFICFFADYLLLLRNKNYLGG